MKRIATIIIVSMLATISSIAQQQEYIHLITDKDCYLAGEDIWLKVCVSDSNNQPLNISKVAYIEVADSEQVYAQSKINLTGGIGNGRIRLPRTMHSGTFQLTAYTRYMRNWGEEAYCRQLIAVINTLQSSEEDKIEWSESFLDIPITTSNNLKSDKEEYTSRSKVTLKWNKLPEAVFGVSLSVVRKDYTLGTAPLHTPSQQAIMQQTAWTAESEGHIVKAKLTGEDSKLEATRLGCVGKDIRIFEGQKGEENTYTYYTHDIYNEQEVAIDAIMQDKSKSERMSIVSPFANKLPQSLPVLQLYSNQEALQERSLSMQVQALLPDSVSGSLMESLYGFTPDISYNLDEWVRFTTVRETLTEFVMGIRVSKRNGENIMRLLREDTNQYSDFKALVLIDGVPIENHEQALAYDARLLQYIHQYQGGYTFGGQVYDGIISMITRKGNLSGLRLADNCTLITYEFPQKDIVFPHRRYENDVEKASRIPDFRHTLYWNPCLNQDADAVVFYTSDIKGTYIATLKGWSPQGNFWEAKAEFIVK